MAQLFDSTAASLRVAGDIYRNYPKEENDCYEKTIDGLGPLVKDLLFTKYTMTDITATPNTQRRPYPAKKDGATNYGTFKAYSKTATWNKKTQKYDWTASKTVDIEKNTFIRNAYNSLSASYCGLMGNTLHLYFFASRGMPELYGNGDMPSGKFQYKLSNDNTIKTCYRDADGIKNGTFLLGWEEREYKVKQVTKNKKTVDQWTYYRQSKNDDGSLKIKWSNKQPTYTITTKDSKGKTKTVQKTEKIKIYYKKDKKGNYIKNKKGKKIIDYRRGFKYVHKYYWAPIEQKSNGAIYCPSYNKINRVVSYPGFKGNLNNELIGTIRFKDAQRRIKAIRGNGFSNEGAAKSGVATFYIGDVHYYCAECEGKKYNSQDPLYTTKDPGPEFVKPPELDAEKDKELIAHLKAEWEEQSARYKKSCKHQTGPDKHGKAQYIELNIHLSALDNRVKPTFNINGHINTPVLLNVNNY